MKLRLIFTEELPRRFSCQFIEMSRKNIENTLNHLYSSEEFYLEKTQVSNLTIDLVFHLSCLEDLNNPTHSRFSVPFGFKPSKQNFSIFKQRDVYLNLNKTNYEPVKTQGSNDRKRDVAFFSNFHCFKKNFFFFIENFSPKYFSAFSIDWRKKKGGKKNWKKINKSAICRLIKLLSFIFLSRMKSSSLKIKIERRNCRKHVINNIIQTIGGVFDSLFWRKKKIYRISLKALNFPEIIFFSSLS
mmetsp:Transcript_24073/g.48613  ORF Transcript_24073/g.48613 Transcript_24073/m.48613 type:complete len:243 (+) Transcript_24073:1051-1779(+)